jgi:hypothetical protein
MHEPVVELAKKAMGLMDDFLRSRLDLDEYSDKLKELDANSILAANKEDFSKDAVLVHYLDVLMLISSLQHELDFQVAEYGSSVAVEDMRNLEELLRKIEKGNLKLET